MFHLLLGMVLVFYSVFLASPFLVLTNALGCLQLGQDDFRFLVERCRVVLS
jgi:hypothetical protein